MSRFAVRHNGTRLPKRSRTIALYGSPDFGDGKDAGKYYRCRHCGFICNIEKNALGGPECSSSGVVYEDYAENPHIDGQGVAVLGGLDEHTFTAQRNDSDGNPIGTVNNIRISNSGSGCGLCGSLNWL